MKNLEDAKRIETARKCLSLISRIAARGACSECPDEIGYALEELSQALFERTGSDRIMFLPVPANEIRGLDQLLVELGFIDSGSSELGAANPVKGAPHGTWN
jgi:hypothetical protein